MLAHRLMPHMPYMAMCQSKTLRKWENWDMCGWQILLWVLLCDHRSLDNWMVPAETHVQSAMYSLQEATELPRSLLLL